MSEINQLNSSLLSGVAPLQNTGITDTKFDTNIQLNTLYSQEELDKIIERFPSLQSEFNGKKCEFDMYYIPESKYLVLNNKNITNTTVEINGKGEARSVGSWHNKPIEGNYIDLINDIETRLSNKNAEGEAKLVNQMDALAELGKSQVK